VAVHLEGVRRWAEISNANWLNFQGGSFRRSHSCAIHVVMTTLGASIMKEQTKIGIFTSHCPAAADSTSPRHRRNANRPVSPAADPENHLDSGSVEWDLVGFSMDDEAGDHLFVVIHHSCFATFTKFAAVMEWPWNGLYSIGHESPESQLYMALETRHALDDHSGTQLTRLHWPNGYYGASEFQGSLWEHVPESRVGSFSRSYPIFRARSLTGVTGVRGRSIRWH